jgi:bifunctional UDP-N-acetylglucosamine pyrophosphorylase/glucosamine-1-phosphate N-acetyltransferase/UDP-N-acetylglucosamine pyrophosphorylase
MRAAPRSGRLAGSDGNRRGPCAEHASGGWPICQRVPISLFRISPPSFLAINAMSKRLAIILAAGKGTRMKSDLPKVLCPVRGRPMIEFVLDALRKAGVDHLLVVVGYRSDLVRQTLQGHADVAFVEQTEQLGTGHAVKMCRPQLAHHDGPVLIVTGDSPLTRVESVAALFHDFDTDRPACVLGTLHKENPTGLGRIVRDSRGVFEGIVEEKDATQAQLAGTEVNMSTYVFDAPKLVRALDMLRNTNRQKEYYLTDCPGILKSWGETVRALPVLQPSEALSINTVSDLAMVEAAMREMGL